MGFHIVKTHHTKRGKQFLPRKVWVTICIKDFPFHFLSNIEMENLPKGGLRTKVFCNFQDTVCEGVFGLKILVADYARKQQESLETLSRKTQKKESVYPS